MLAPLVHTLLHIIDLSNRELVNVWGDHLSVSEIFGFVTGAASVWLCVRLRTANWPIGIANDLFFLILFWSAALYANAGLQVLYAALGVWGWWAWIRGGEHRTPVIVSRTTRREWFALAAAMVALTVGLTWLLGAASNSTGPFWDALTTAMSVVATWGQCLKKVESWFIWLAVDAIYVPLYGSEHLGLTAVLYIGFFVMCIVGLRDWRHELAEQSLRPVAGMIAVHGLIVGKFYPPHAGHQFLIDTAASVCENVTVVVAAADVETIPLDRRVSWIRQAHADQPTVHVVGCTDNHRIDYRDPAVWDLHMAVFRGALAHSPVREPVDAVFTSEPYGQELARRLDARWAGPQPGRQPHAISASDIRADPAAHWDRIAPPVRAWFAKRVVVGGAESTGTTTLTRDLFEFYRRRGGPYGLTQSVPEYGRELTWRKLAALAAGRALEGRPAPTMDDLDWTDADFEHVVATQNHKEDVAAALGGPLLLCDTDSWVTRLWQERYMGHITNEVIAGSARSDRSLYILTHHDGVPFIQDGIRDGAHIRADMTRSFIHALGEQDLPYVIADAAQRGRRLATAVRAIDEVLAQGWTLGAPLSGGQAVT